jgi:hypothetical protein
MPITKKDLAKLEINIEDIAKAFVDLAEGNDGWWDFHRSTGLPEERCKELSEMRSKLAKRFY